MACLERSVSSHRLLFKALAIITLISIIILCVLYRFRIFVLYNPVFSPIVVQLNWPDNIVDGEISEASVPNDKNASFNCLDGVYRTECSGNSTCLGNPKNMKNYLDVHIENSGHSHSGDTNLGHIFNFLRRSDQAHVTRIAIGLGITSKSNQNTDTKSYNVQSIQFFTDFLPTFCATLTSGAGKHEFHFYVAYDLNDPMFTDCSILEKFHNYFVNISKQRCPKDTNLLLHFVQCSHQGKPAWAQNDAMMEAYLDGMDYFYRINDDSILKTSGWAETFIATLSGFDPPNVGVVGPDHKGGNTAILTYDFVHRTHIDIFGFYYPRVYPAWYADNWITNVYKPGQRSVKLRQISVVHTMKSGQRYRNDPSVEKHKPAQFRKDKITLNRYYSLLY